MGGCSVHVHGVLVSYLFCFTCLLCIDAVRLSVRLSRAYFFLRIILGMWALTRTENEIPIVKIGKLPGHTQLRGRPHSGRPLNGRTLLFCTGQRCWWCDIEWKCNCLL